MALETSELSEYGPVLRIVSLKLALAVGLIARQPFGQRA